MKGIGDKEKRMLSSEAFRSVSVLSQVKMVLFAPLSLCFMEAVLKMWCLALLCLLLTFRSHF